MKKVFQKIERFTLWVGALCGITLASIDIASRLNMPNPPELEVEFALSATSNLSIAVNGMMKNMDIPLDLIVTNTGGKTARAVRLSLVESELCENYLYTRIRIAPDNSGIGEKTMNIGGTIKGVTTLVLDDINPGESRLLNSVLRLQKNYAPILVKASEPLCLDVTPRHHTVDTRISAENLHPKDIQLCVTLGYIKHLGDLSKPIFTPTNEGVLVLAN